MKQRRASGAVGMLLTLLIIAIMFIIMMPMLKNTGSANISGSSLDKKSVEQEVNEQVEQIQNIRQQTMQYNNQVQQEEY